MMPEVCCAGQSRSVEMAAGVVCLSAAHLTFAMDAHFERAVGAVGRPRIWIVAQAILGAEFAVDAVKHFTEFAGRIWEISRAARGIRNGLEGMLSRGVAAALVFHHSNHDRVEKRVGSKCSPPPGLKVGTAVRFPS